MDVTFCFSCVFLFIICVLGDEEFEGLRTLTLEHSIDTGIPSFSKRGSIMIKSLKSNRAQFTQASPLAYEEKEQLSELSRSDGLYRLRIPVKSQDDEITYISTFTKACSIYESSLSDIIVVSVDQTGELLGLSVSTYPSYCSGLEVSDSNLNRWNTTVEISQTVNGPVPDTQGYIEKMKKEEQAKARGQQEDNRSFFAKYWMYIVPVLILMMVASSQEPAQGR